MPPELEVVYSMRRNLGSGGFCEVGKGKRLSPAIMFPAPPDLSCLSMMHKDGSLARKFVVICHKAGPAGAAQAESDTASRVISHCECCLECLSSERLIESPSSARLADYKVIW